MFKRFLFYSLIVLLAAQSFMAVADIHQSHQSGSEHISFDHDHDAPVLGDAASDKFFLNDTATDGFDCHHCCHCHGLGFAALLFSSTIVANNKTNTSVPAYSFHYSSRISKSLFRPPIV